MEFKPEFFKNKKLKFKKNDAENKIYSVFHE